METVRMPIDWHACCYTVIVTLAKGKTMAAQTQWNHNGTEFSLWSYDGKLAVYSFGYDCPED